MMLLSLEPSWAHSALTWHLCFLSTGSARTHRAVLLTLPCGPENKTTGGWISASIPLSLLCGIKAEDAF